MSLQGHKTPARRRARPLFRGRLLVALLCGALPLSAAASVRVVDSGDDFVRLLYERGPANPLESLEYSLLGLPLAGNAVVDVEEAVPGPLLAPPELAGLSTDLFAAGPVHLGPPGFMRDQRVATLHFGPAPAAGGSLQMFDRLLVCVRFTAASSSSRREGSAWEEQLYSALLNRGQARRWRRAREAPAARTGLPEAGTQRLRIAVRGEGMVRIRGRDLAQWGIDASQLNPDRFRLLYGGGRVLPLDVDPQPVQLLERPILVDDGGDGRLDPDDFILFAGEPISRWHHTAAGHRFIANPYTDENVYFLELAGAAEGLRIGSRSSRPDAGAEGVETYRARLHREEENHTVAESYGIKSGYEWYWETFRRNFLELPVTLSGAAEGPVVIRIGIYGFTNTEHRIDVYWNGHWRRQLQFTGPFHRTFEVETSRLKEGENKLRLAQNSGIQTRLDWFELEFNRRLRAEDGALLFDAMETGPANYQLEGFKGERPRVFEVSPGLIEVVDFEYDEEAGTVAFGDPGSTAPRRYVATGASRWLEPVRIELASPTSLTYASDGADYVIISHRDFMDAAGRLAAWRAADDRFGPPLTTMVVNVSDVYDAFSGGPLDPAAIRNFIAFATGSWSSPPLFVTLLGDATYDYRNNAGDSPVNWLPAFQDGESTYDDWYVRVSGDDQLPDLAIGRLPVRTAAEAETVVRKLIDYDRQPEPGSWQSRVLMVADDLVNPAVPEEPEDYFLLSTEFLARSILPRGLDQVKHYIADFPRVGLTKPQARDEFIRLFNEGALLVIYVGHGNPDVLAHEQMFVLSRDADRIRNNGRLPLMYTAASQVGVFDDPLRDSMPELLLKIPNGGVIGMISATRVGIHDANMLLASSFHRKLFPDDGVSIPIGLALTSAKVAIEGGYTRKQRGIIERYALMGDPATRLALPSYRVAVELPDTLRALEEIHIEGRVIDPAGELVRSYRGDALVQVFDSSSITLLDHLKHLKIGSHLFRGTAEVDRGRFATAFRVPKDITYKGNRGRVSAYLSSPDNPSAFGYTDRIVFAGPGADAELAADHSGPTIEIGIRGQRDFASGDLVATSPIVRAAISDPSGINIAGDTGHEIILDVDGLQTTVTHAFVNGPDYRHGTLEYQLPALPTGEYVVGLKAWDSLNNSAAASVTMRVGGTDPTVSDLLLHPNPLTGDTGYLTFNLFSPVSSARVGIYALSGRLIDQVEIAPEPGYNQISWSAPPRLANGTYLYRLRLEGEDGAGRKRVREQTGVIQLLR